MEKIFKLIEENKAAMIASIQESMHFESVKADPQPGAPFGVENRKALDHALTLAASFGFQTKNLDGYCGYAEYGDGAEYVAVLGHLDIVALGEGWSVPPLEGRIVDNQIIGRGCTDNKGPIIAALYALKAIKDADVQLKRRVRIIFGCNEESGMKDMEYYVAHEPAPAFGFTPDGGFPVVYGEKGGIHPFFSMEIVDKGNGSYIESIFGGDTMNIVPTAATAIVVTEDTSGFAKAASAFPGIIAEVKPGKVVLTASGTAAHGSTPEKGDNAITKLMEFLAKQELTGSIAEFVRIINRIIGREVNGQLLGIGYEDIPSGKLTLNLARIRCENDVISIGCDVRIPVTFKPEQAADDCALTAANNGLQLEIGKFTHPLYFPKDSYLVTTLNAIFCKHFGKELEPITMGGGTYAKKLPNTVAFGMGIPGGKSGREHNADENYYLDELMFGTSVIAEAMCTLAR
ncbi:MAG: Sapep family Mn(2+)-dependent dipeptidase [Negativicutes bacterium]|jgi:succinyl-diaminopimelate desuccinylase